MGDEGLEGAFEAARLGEPWALGVLYRELAPKVLGYLRGRGASDPEDLASEVFLTVFTGLPKLTGGVGGLRRFLFSVAHARLVDDLRRRSRQTAPVEYEPAADPRSTPGADEAALGGLGDRGVVQVLGLLPADQRDVLLMRIVADLSLEEVASVLGRSPGAVKQLQRRGLVALRAMVASGTVVL